MLIEIFLAPGLIIPGVLGFFMMIGAIFGQWSTFGPPGLHMELRCIPIASLGVFAITRIAFALGIVVSIILPRTPDLEKFGFKCYYKGSETGEGTTKEIMAALVGREGRTSSELFPGGKWK